MLADLATFSALLIEAADLFGHAEVRRLAAWRRFDLRIGRAPKLRRASA
jgi:hypothetical protein